MTSYSDRAHSMARQVAFQTKEIHDASACPVFVNGFLCGYTNDKEMYRYSYKESQRFRGRPSTPAWVRGWHQGQRMAGYE